MKPRVAYAHLCDYAGLGNNGKPIVVGIFDTVYHADEAGPVAMPLCYFITKIEASLATGTEHEVSVVIRHEDGEIVHQVDFGSVQFQATGPGRPLSAAVIMLVAGMPFPARGDYAFEVVVDRDGAEPAGAAPLYFLEAPPA